jgi:hypothetical protein
VRLAAATIEKCDICEAPFKRPLPEGWTITSHMIGRRNYAVVHLPSCPLGWVAPPPDARPVDESDG